MQLKISDSPPQTDDRGAVETALLLLRQPGQLRATLRRAVPGDVLHVLKVAAGDSQTIMALSELHGVDEADLKNAARFYVQSILAHAKNDDRRLLCLPEGADAAAAKEHKKWLLKWLHPDRNHDSWESALFIRVNEAYIRFAVMGNVNDNSPQTENRAPAGRRVHRGIARQHRYHAYEKLDGNGLLRQTAKPLLLAMSIAGMACLLIIWGNAHLTEIKTLLPSFSFFKSAN